MVLWLRGAIHSFSKSSAADAPNWDELCKHFAVLEEKAAREAKTHFTKNIKALVDDYPTNVPANLSFDVKDTPILEFKNVMDKVFGIVATSSDSDVLFASSMSAAVAKIVKFSVCSMAVCSIAVCSR